MQSAMSAVKPINKPITTYHEEKIKGVLYKVTEKV